MDETLKSYQCVRCGEPADALFKQYGPSVLKLTKCKCCGGFVDKYVEYDPVIVMIDLILMSKEAQRHVLYNTEFKAYWKLLILLVMLETYGMWRRDGLSINTYCQHTHNYTQYLPVLLRPSSCVEWTDSPDLFITEKNFYLLFISVSLGVAAFIASSQFLMSIIPTAKRKYVSLKTLSQAFALSYVSLSLTLPTLVWGGSAHYLHYCLVLLYSAGVFYNVYSVVFSRHLLMTSLVLSLSFLSKLHITLSADTFLRQFLA